MGQWEEETVRDLEVKVWAIKLKYLKISVHRHIDFEKDEWLCSCYQLQVINKLLKSKNIISAKNEAINYLTKITHRYYKDLMSYKTED